MVGACPVCRLVVLSAVCLGACGDIATLPVSAGYGANPTLPPPYKALIPTVNVASAVGWPTGRTPQTPPNLRVAAFASGLDHPRWIHVLPNGDVLVAETNAPPRPEDGKGFRGWVMGLLMKRAGAAAPSANRITLLRDTDGDGVADMRSVLLEGLNSPFGMALAGDNLFVANSDAVLRFPYATGDLRIKVPGLQVVALPAGPINHHWTKNLLATPDGKTLYVTVGSNSNVGERGLEAEAGRAAIWQIDALNGAHRVFASGLRNPNGMAWEPISGALWTVVNERDELGSDLVPDYLTSVRDGGFYGWPFTYFGHYVDERAPAAPFELVTSAASAAVAPAKVAAPGLATVPERVHALVPDYALGPHTASLGLAASAGTSLPGQFSTGMFIGQHGSWNRRPRSGYKVIFVPFEAGRPAGPPLDVLTGFLSEGGRAYGRPVGVALDKGGALLVADDVGNVIWRVTAR